MNCKIYYIPGFLAGPLSTWPRHFERIRRMGFEQICVAPIGTPSQSGDIFLPDDADRVDVRLGRFDSPNSLIADLAEAAGKHGLTVLIDVILDRVAVDGAMACAHPELFGPPDER